MHFFQVCMKVIYNLFILQYYLKFKLSNNETAFVPRDNVIFYGISLKFMIYGNELLI
jgi:hypothetical protein